MKRFWTVLVSVVLALTFTVGLTGCGSKDTYVDEDGNVKKKTILTFLGWGNVQEHAIFKTMVEEFNKTFPQYKVNYDPLDTDNYITTLANRKNNPRNMPDVFYMPDINFVQWIYDTDIMLDLTPYIASSDTFTTDNVWEEGLDAYRFDPETQQLGTGNIYALPKDLGPNVLAYNKKIIADKGVTVISDPAGQKGYDPQTKTLNDKVSMTWAQFVAFCKDVKSGSLSETNSVVGVTHYPLESAYISMGERFLDETNKVAHIDTPEFAESLQFVADLSNKYGVMTTSEGQASQNGNSRFTSGLAATSWIGAWNTPELWECTFDWDILPSPVPNESGNLDDVNDLPREGASGASYLGSVGLAVYSGSAHKDGAYKLAEFLSVGKAAQRINYELGMAVPNLKDMATGEFLTAELSDPKGLNRPKNRGVYIDVINNSPRRPQAYTYSDDWWDEMWESATDSYKLARVWSTSANYGGHVDVWDWNTNSKIENGFLAGLQGKMQAQLDKTKGKYNWKI